MVRGKACVSVSGTGTVDRIEPFKPALLRGSFRAALLRALAVPGDFIGTI